MVRTRSQSVDLTVQATVSILLPDSSTLRVSSEPLQLQVSDRYLSINPNGSTILDVTQSGSLSVNFSLKNQSGSLSIPPQYPIDIRIIDDIDQSLVYSGVVSGTSFSIPYSVSKKVGSYRILAQDRDGTNGEMTFSVRS